MDSWDVALLVVAGYGAISALVRLMIWRRDQLLAEFHSRMKTEKKRKKRKEEEEKFARRQREAA
ncbi:MAG: hypothetical protein ACYTG0_36565 [Planctomycetota bacterium]|jgi:hypothetical protein